MQISFPLHVSCGAIMSRKNDKGITEIFLLHRFKNHEWKYDSWHLPKGTQDDGETYEQTVIREIFEETGFRIKPITQLGELYSTYERNGTTRQKKTIYFICNVIDRPNDQITEHDEAKWVPLDDAMRLVSTFPLYESEEEILRKYKESL